MSHRVFFIQELCEYFSRFYDSDFHSTSTLSQHILPQLLRPLLLRVSCWYERLERKAGLKLLMPLKPRASVRVCLSLGRGHPMFLDMTKSYGSKARQKNVVSHSSLKEFYGSPC